MVNCQYEKITLLTDLKPHPKNRNIHPKSQIERLAKLMAHQGVRHPIIVSNLSGFIVAGHGRLQALKHLGLKEAPVDYQDFKDEAEEYAFLTSDNAIALWAELDMAEIGKDILDYGPEFDVEHLGFKDFKIEPAEFEANEKEVDENLPTEKECPSCGYRY